MGAHRRQRHGQHTLSDAVCRAYEACDDMALAAAIERMMERTGYHRRESQKIRDRRRRNANQE